jgi:DNA repair protein RadD
LSDYPYQRRIIQKVERLIAGGHLKITIQAPTGSGKTRMALRLVERAGLRRVLYTVPTQEIHTQTHLGFERAGIKHVNLLAGTRPSLTGHKVVLATNGTLVRRIKEGYFDSWHAEYLIVDEIHRLLDQHKGTITEFNSIVVGLTATPVRLDGRELSDLTPQMVVGPSLKYLIRTGRLVPCHAFIERGPELSNLRLLRGEYERRAMEAAYTRRDVAHAIVEAWQRRAPGKRTIVFTAGVSASQALVSAFTQAGVRAVHIDAKTSDKDRDKALGMLRAQEVDVICNVGLFIEGLDLVETECVLLAMGTMSLAKYLQCVGRGLRKSPHTGKKHLVVIDCGGNIARHGPPDGDRDWAAHGLYLGGQVKACRFCHALRDLEPTPCAACGWKEPLPAGASPRALKQASKRTPPRPVPAWAGPVAHLWLTSERARQRHGYPLPAPYCAGFSESRCMQALRGR